MVMISVRGHRVILGHVNYRLWGGGVRQLLVILGQISYRLFGGQVSNGSYEDGSIIDDVKVRLWVMRSGQI